MAVVVSTPLNTHVKISISREKNDFQDSDRMPQTKCRKKRLKKGKNKFRAFVFAVQCTGSP